MNSEDETLTCGVPAGAAPERFQKDVLVLPSGSEVEIGFVQISSHRFRAYGQGTQTTVQFKSLTGGAVPGLRPSLALYYKTEAEPFVTADVDEFLLDVWNKALSAENKQMKEMLLSVT